MKLSTIARYLETDEIVLECKGEIASFEGKDAIRDMLNHFGDAEVIRIIPGDNNLNIDIK